MKRYATIVLLAGLVFITKTNVLAQKGELFLQTGYNMWLANSKDLTSFYKSYNTSVNGVDNDFKEKVGIMNGYGFVIGSRFFTEKAYFDLGFSTNRYASAINKVKFDDGDSREILVKTADWGFDFGFGWGKRFCAGMMLGMGAQRTTVNAGYRYANGTISYGPEYNLNGVYRALKGSLYYGFTADFRVVKYLRLGVSAIRLATLLPVDKFVYSDNSLIKGTGTNTYVPINYVTYASGGSFEDNEAGNDLRGWRISFIARIQLPYGNN
jgi:hypothetical protein